MRPIAIDLFAGAGGMSLGFEQAGFDVVAAVEIDPVHCAVHKFNFPHCTIIPRSVVGLKGSEIRLAAGIGNRTIDVVFGGAPCQGFSMIGRRALDDPRNSLVLDFLRIASELDARAFVFENVKGLTVGKHRQILDEIVETSREFGFDVRLPWKVLNAADFGVPQRRERLFLFGANETGNLARYPVPTSLPADTKKPAHFDLPVGPTVSDALDDLPDADNFHDLLDSDTVESPLVDPSNNYANELRCRTNGAWHYGYLRNWDNTQLTCSMRTDHSAISRRRFAETNGGQTEPVSRFFKLSPLGLSNTLRAGTDGARGAFTSPRPIHHRLNRCVTVREMARLHGYPDWFRFHQTKWHGARQVGNSVPPPLARAVANSAIAALDMPQEVPFEVLDLGDPKLLALTSAQASKLFGVEPLVARRDRKSGATKRKQIDIESEHTRLKFLSNG